MVPTVVGLATPSLLASYDGERAPLSTQTSSEFRYGHTSLEEAVLFHNRFLTAFLTRFFIEPWSHPILLSHSANMLFHWDLLDHCTTGPSMPENICASSETAMPEVFQQERMLQDDVGYSMLERRMTSFLSPVQAAGRPASGPFHVHP